MTLDRVALVIGASDSPANLRVAPEIRRDGGE
jgi:hypothetical protein